MKPLLASIALLFIVASTCARKPLKEKINILWLVTEDISPYLSCYGDSTAHTPNLDRLAKEGVRYSNVCLVLK